MEKIKIRFTNDPRDRKKREREEKYGRHVSTFIPKAAGLSLLQKIKLKNGK